MSLEVNKVYKHRSGTLYTLVAISNLEATKDSWHQQAVYVDESGVIWSRPAEEFEEKMVIQNDIEAFAFLFNFPEHKQED